MVGLGNLLRFVEEIGKGIPSLLTFSDHLLGRVGWMSSNIVGTNGNHTNALRHQLSSQGCQLISHMLDVGTMVADEHHHGSPGSGDVCEGQRAAVNIHQRKLRGGGSEREHGAGGANHNLFSRQAGIE